MKRRRPLLPSILLFAGLAIAPGLAGAQNALLAPSDRVAVWTEPSLNQGQADLEISSSVGGGELYVDKNDSGSLPTGSSLKLSLAPGSHYLEILIPGYHDLGMWFMLEEKTLYHVLFKPMRITGFLSLEVAPGDATVLVDGSPAGSGRLEVPAGRHTITFKRFGYLEKNLSAIVVKDRTTLVSQRLEKAAFAISGLGFSRAVFNPRNAGSSGRSSLDFQASSYGSAVAEFRSPGGELVARLAFPEFGTWSQSRSWDGLDRNGAVLPDAVYSVLLIASPAPGVPVQTELPLQAPGGSAQELGEGGTILASLSVRIDSSIVVRALGTASALPGLLYMPDALPQPAGTVATEAFWFAPWAGVQASAFGVSAALSLGGSATLAVHAAAETGGGPANAADLALSTLLALFGDGSSRVEGGLFIKGSYSSASTPALPGALSAIEASLPVSLPLALRSGELSFSLSPGARAGFSSGTPDYLGLLRAGLMLEGPSFRIGASGELPLSFSGGLPAASWPARAALEGRLMLGSSPFVAAAYLDAALEPGRSPVLGVGIGLGLLF